MISKETNTWSAQSQTFWCFEICFRCVTHIWACALCFHLFSSLRFPVSLGAGVRARPLGLIVSNVSPFAVSCTSTLLRSSSGAPSWRINGLSNEGLLLSVTTTLGIDAQPSGNITLSCQVPENQDILFSNNISVVVVPCKNIGLCAFYLFIFNPFLVVLELVCSDTTGQVTNVASLSGIL